MELGGGHSCFLEPVLRHIRPQTYHVVDNNEYGLELVRQRWGTTPGIFCHRQDVLDLSLKAQADVIFSVGLIEHFDARGTRRAIEAHFDLLRPGGWAIISFPTPTWLYRVARAVAEGLGWWRFHDERPLARDEVLAAMAGRGRVVWEKVLWPLAFTQRILVVQKAEH